jgi:acetamidase/formamidase
VKIMSGSLQRCVARSLTVGAVAGLASLALAQSAPPNPTPDATLRSTPENVIWGYITADLPPVLTIKSGQTVRIDTVSHHGLLTRDDPVAYFGKAGIRADEVLQDAIDIYQKGVRARGSSVHVLTGPIYIEEAAPGDMLEVRVHKLEHRVPYGVNSGGPRSGVLPDLLSAPALKIIKLDLARNVALFSPEIEIPLAPFLGIMSVAPSRDVLLVSSRPPWRWGGNIDFNKLTPGSSLYLPVFNNGAQFFTGDPHAVQGDGEVNGSAIEASLTATLQFVVHKGAGKDMRWPRAEDATHYYLMGMDLDLDVAMRHATRETVDFLREEFGLSPQDAYSLASLAVDFHVAEAVDSVQMVYGMVPKKLFKKTPEFWSAR